MLVAKPPQENAHVDMGPDGHHPSPPLHRLPARSCLWWDHFKCGPHVHEQAGRRRGANVGSARRGLCLHALFFANVVMTVSVCMHRLKEKLDTRLISDFISALEQLCSPELVLKVLPP